MGRAGCRSMEYHHTTPTLYLRFLLGQSAALWSGFPQAKQLKLGFWKVCEPPPEIEVSVFRLTSFFRRFSANSWAFFLSSLFMTEMVARTRFLLLVVISPDWRRRSGSPPESEETSPSSDSEESELLSLSSLSSSSLFSFSFC